MAAFTSGDVSATTTASKVVEAAEFDRLVIVRTTGPTKFGYGSSSLAYLSGAVPSFPLPAGHEFWAAAVSGTETVSYLVTVK